MSDVEYTDNMLRTGSSVVDEIHYNHNTNELTVDLSDTVYTYPGVPSDVWDEFRKADSKGNFYANEIKCKFGPSKNLGNYMDVNYICVDKEKTEVPAHSIAASSQEVRNADNTLSVSGDGAAKVTGPLSVFSLKPFSEKPAGSAVVPQGTKFKHSIVFEANGTRRTYTTEAGSVNEAVGFLSEVADALGVTLKVKEVTVYFE